MRTIELIVQPNGQLKIDAVGFSGPDCERATAFLEKALGTVKAKAKKPDFYRQVNRQQTVGQ